jgi:hypothetical protein
MSIEKRLLDETQPVSDGYSTFNQNNTTSDMSCHSRSAIATKNTKSLLFK